MKVLIVDDNADDRKLLRLNLERHGCVEVIEACDGQEGSDSAKAHHPDLIVSDALMPRLDGFQFLRRIKLDPELRGIPFVFHSSVYTGSRDEELAHSLGAAAFIAKPKEPEALWQELMDVLTGPEFGKTTPLAPPLLAEEQDYLKQYSGVVAAKLEEKVKELEEALARRKEAEEALRTQFAQFSTIFDALNALVYVADLEDGEILSMNRYGSQLFGADWQGKKYYELFPSHHGEPLGECSSDRLVQDGIPQPPYIWEFYCPVNGRWYQGIDRAIRWTDGRLVRLRIAFDITERKEIERIKDEMLSAVSHEMRTPLTALIGYTELMLANDLSKVQLKEYLKVVQGEADKLNELIGNFLDVQRQKSRGSRAGFRPLNLCTLLKKIAAHCGATAPLHQILVDCQAALDPVVGDERLLRRMFELLISNAIKFSPHGGKVWLSAAMESGRIAVKVEDQGIGIPAEYLEKIFEPFFRVDNTDRRIFGGAGLGLALVREIALGHGGKIWAESRIGQGSTFFVFLPAHIARTEGA